MQKYVILFEDEPELAQLVSELLEEAGHMCVHVTTVEDLLEESSLHLPCVALIDSTDPKEFDLWELGPRLRGLGAAPVAFTAHSSAKEQFEASSHGFVAIVTKPFDADEFVQTIDAICLRAEELDQAAS